MGIKVSFIGNLDNLTYWYVKNLREIGVDAYLYVEFKKYDRQGRPVLAFNSDPRDVDRNLNKELPEWVKFYHTHSLKNFININREFNQYNLNISFARIPILTQFCKKPLISFVTGQDMRGWIFESHPLPILLKRALKKSKAVLHDNVDMDTLEALDRLKINDSEWIPDFTGKDYLLEIADKSAGKIDPMSGFKEKFICLSPARPIFKIKGSDILIKGFVNFVRKSKISTRLLIIDRDGDGTEAANLIKKLGAGDVVSIIAQMPKADLLKLMSKCAVVFGYFKNGSSGVHHFPVTIEDGLAMGNIIISSIDDRAFQKVVGEEPPVLKAFTEKDIENQLEFVFANYDQAQKDAAANGIRWTEKYHSKDFINEKLIKMINRYAE